MSSSRSVSHVPDRLRYGHGSTSALSLVVLGALVVVLVTPVNVSAAPGDLDPTFGTGGKVTTDFAGQFDQAFAMAIQGDGKIVAGGRAANPARGSDPDFALARYNLGGSLDTAFGTGGKVVTDFNLGPDVVASVAIQADGKIVAAGIVAPGHTGTEFGLARYTPDGTLDPTFGTGGRVVTDFQGSNDGALAVAIQTDGRIVAAGAATIGPRFDFALARYNPDGTLDPAFGSDGKVTTDSSFEFASAVAIQAEGRIVAAGATGGGQLADFALARYLDGARVDLTVAKADSPDPVQVGMPLTYTVTVGNEGPGDDPLVTVTDQLPPDSDARFLSAETTQGRCREQRGVVTCDLGSLAVGATATVTIVVRPIGDTNVLLNTARVLGANIDQNPGNNADTEETAVRTGGP